MVMILVGLVAISAVMAVGLQDVPVSTGSNEWQFDYVPSDDFVITAGATALLPGAMVVVGLGTTFEIDPFFTTSQTDITVLPTFAANHVLETGLGFNWWSATVDVDLSLAPWALTSTGGWLELHPPEWMLISTPRVTLDGGIGWGPRWAPVGGWSHALAGALNAQAGWIISTLWDSALELTAESNFAATWTFPNGVFVTDWLFTVDARSILPLFQGSSVALRGGVTARMFVFPTFGFGFDLKLELRANAFYAYVLVGAGDAGIIAEIGAEMAIGL